MTIPILVTKLYIPPPRSKVVLRSHLLERLNEGLRHNRKLSLITAPAGFGKTTLVSAWVATCNRKVTWLSLDQADSDPTRFLTYLIASLQKIVPNISTEWSMLQATQPASTEAVLTALLNEITTTADSFILVLDDYHHIEAKAVDAILNFLVEQLPPQMHLVIASREVPRLPLARLRARGQLTELRATDLRFSSTETSGFLQQVMGLDISARDIAALETHTEGWVAGLQLAALSMQEHKDIPEFVRTFSGDHWYIFDYLVEEVLQRQSASLRNFLLQTAILDRLCGPLCEALTGQPNGSAQLEALEQGNFFIIPLDNKRQWYRYHHLFAEVLYARLKAETAANPDHIAALHRQASEWYEHNGLVTEALPYAIRHAVLAGDFEGAANLIERVVPEMRESSQEAAMLNWFKTLPARLIHVRPVLSVGYAGALLSSGELEGVEAHLRVAEQWLSVSATTQNMPAVSGYSLAEMVVLDEAEFRRLPGSIAMYRAGYAMAVGDVAGTIAHAKKMFDLVTEDDYFLRGAAAALLGLAFWSNGDLEAASQTLAEGMVSIQKAENSTKAGGGLIALANIQIAQGRLTEAANTCKRALEQAEYLAPQQNTFVLRARVDMYAGMSEIHYERNELDAAMQCLEKSQELGQHSGLARNRYRWWVALARLREAQGDLEGVLEALHEAERVYVVDFSPNVRPIAALRVRLWLVQGLLAKAEEWLHKQGLGIEDKPGYLREFEYITLARLLMAQFKSNKSGDESNADHTLLFRALGLLERLLQAAEQADRTRSRIEILILIALAYQMQNNIAQALQMLEQALGLAESESYIRVFVDEGKPMAILLENVAHAKQRNTRNYARQLLAALGKTADITPPDQPGLLEPLSLREFEVLRMLRTELTGPEIATKLVVSLPTLRTHTNNVYRKLGINNRRAAVRRAEELGLL